ncbi:alpha/beta hydrolase [Natronorubrum aibiense]|uniref:Alpha/beta hydrolase fold domain-containing protein n=1 Tax=Natronorubrum aibiense TaxID=348826 RepID=A0A5P9P8K4_9EURY|nr:alpha/beta hydrolase [Natronorubrum aibiense]QFU84438.1 alpha/beta hydrolase fold domain-containing protein [Natronorubrum aibiense]
MSSKTPVEVTAADEPHQEISGLLEQMGAAPAPTFNSLSPEGAREMISAMFPTREEPEPVGDTMDLKIGDEGIPIRVYVPEGEGPYPTFLYLHGGGWVVGDIDLYDATCRAITNKADCMVVSVDYRLAPEYEFPTPVEDCYTAAEWVFDTAEPMQIDTDNVAIGGDSAGGNLAAAVTLLARERDGPTFDHQVLIYPVTDHEFDTTSYQENAEGYLLTKADMEWFWEHYLRDDIDAMSPYASPLKAESLEGLPSATVATCGFDPLCDEGAAYAARLEDAGVDVTHHHYDDAIHGIVQMLVEPMDLTRGRELIGDVATDLQRVLD